ncbi:MAG: peptidylprolyl isomerase [Armatimonadetes bacterium]|nr:peptidylprolyl isomerase [Armatimonadota bacterium]
MSIVLKEVLNPIIIIETERGKIILELFKEEVPQIANNFIGLIKNGFYNGLTFHKVIPGVLIKGGCFKGDSPNGPGYIITCKIKPKKHYERILSMPQEKINTERSQFFICCQTAQMYLEDSHIVFGMVIKGIEVIDKIMPGDKMIRLWVEKE